MGLFSPLHCSANHRAGSHLRFFRRGDTLLDRRRAVAAFSSEVLSVRGGCFTKFAAKTLPLQQSRTC